MTRNARRRLLVSVRAVALVALAALLGSGGAVSADPGTTSILPWIFDGPVLASARLGNTLYVGGDFAAVAPSENALPSVYALSDSTGGVLGPAFPAMNGDVYAIEPDGAGGHFLGGSFTVVGALSQPYLAHVLADGTVDPVFRPQLTGAVGSLGRLGTSLYASGGFSGPGGTPPQRFGAVSTVDGARLPWQPPVPDSLSSRGLLVADDRVVIWGVNDVIKFTLAQVVTYDVTTGAHLWSVSVSGGVQQFPNLYGVVRAANHLVVASDRGVSKLALATGVSDPNWNPQVVATALAVAGSTLYLGGTFSSVGGQPRLNLAAVDVDTAAVLPWNPPGAPPIGRIAPMASGAVYVSGSFASVGGQPRHHLARIEASGALSAWVADARPDTVAVLREGPGGSVLVASSLTASGSIARRGLAAFDLTNGALLPWAPSLSGVRFMSAAGDRVWAGTSGTTFVYDATTGFEVAFVGNSTPFFADERWVYRMSWWPLTATFAIERADMITGSVDPSWRPSMFMPESVAVQGDLLYFASTTEGVAAVDRRTAHVRWANPSAHARFVAAAGDTVFAYDSFATGLQSFDARGGQPIRSVASTWPNTEGLTIADGRLMVLAWPSPVALALDGQALSWSAGLGRTLSGSGGHVSMAGDLLVIGGRYGRRSPDAVQGLVVLPLDGARAPASLQAQPSGSATTFSWVPPAVAPSDGYVIEASTVPGQTQVTVPVGAGASFRAEVPGTFYVRVRTTGAPGGIEEVSNEIRVSGGCTGAPAPPAALSATLTGGSVNLSWVAPDAMVTRYLVEAGSAPGLADLAAIAWPGEQTTLTAAAPAGTYHVRVRANNTCGSSAPSPDIYFTVGAPGALPAAPTDLRMVDDWNPMRWRMEWTAPPGDVTGYILEVGTDIGLANLLVTQAGPYPAFGVPPFTPPGTYIVRVRAVNAVGVGPPSADFVLRL